MTKGINVMICLLMGICCFTFTSCSKDSDEGTNFTRSKFVFEYVDDAEEMRYIELLPGQTKKIRVYLGTGMKKYNGVAADWSINNNSVATILGRGKTMRSNSNSDEDIEVYQLANITANENVIDDTTTLKVYLHFADVKRTISIPVHVTSLGNMAKGSFIQKLDVTPYSITMCYVEGGEFTMGNRSEESNWIRKEQENGTYVEDDQPHHVRVSDYFVSTTEITTEVFNYIIMLAENYIDYDFPRDRYPANSVSIEDCRDFIKALNKLTGHKYRLLTEAEWEYAARGGIATKQYVFSGGDDIDKVAWYEGNSRGPVGSPRSCHIVAQKEPNELGLYDMTGNLAEWCSDRYSENTYLTDNSKGTVVNPTGPTTSGTQEYVYRGGDYMSKDMECRISKRNHADHNELSPRLGFRVAMSYDDYVELLKEKKNIIMEVHNFE